MPRKKKELISSLRGMHDILPEDQIYWDKVHKVTFNIAKFYGFGYLETPIIEETSLFKRTLGEDSDVVGKEMYSFRTRGGDSVSLRPENTAGVARAYIQHGWASLPQPKKVFYYGPMFRHEKPQSGRFRSFHQFGFEMLGIEDALADAEIVQMTHALLCDLGINNFMVEVNTIGDKDDRIKYKKELKDYFRPHMKKVCNNCKDRYKSNPLRILDCKKESCQEFIENAPQIIDHVSDSAKNHFKRFLEFLDQSEIPYLLNPRLVRGLDYYNRTVFEFYQEDNKSAQGALASGGRYDGLVKLLGGKNTAAVGIAGGIERIIKIMKEKSPKATRTQGKVFLVQLGELAKKRGLSLMEEFRKAGIHVEESLGRHSIRSQMKIADKMGVKLALILGQKEALADEIIIRDMKSGAQETMPLNKIMKEIKKRLKA
jgi:histidyl-tRNA synthetase